MIALGHVLAFAGAAFVIILVPGPSVLFVIGRALTIGRRGALLTVVGNTGGLLVQVVLVAFGVGAVVQQSVVLYTVIRLVGACYLVYLGARAFRYRKTLAAAMHATLPASGTRQVMREGFLVGITNPKSIVFFVAVLPAFTDRDAGHLSTQLLLLGGIFATIALISDGAWGLLAARARDWFANSPRRVEAIGGAGGLMIMGLGLTLAVTGRHG